MGEGVGGGVRPARGARWLEARRSSGSAIAAEALMNNAC